MPATVRKLRPVIMDSVRPLTELHGPNDPFQFTKLSDVDSVPIEWVWKPYIPKAALTLVMGDGGYGKSWLTCAVAADLSKGRGLPGQEPMDPKRVLMISAEDGISQVIKPKMELLDADMNLIQASDRGFTLDADAMVHLVKYIETYDVAIVFLDPLVVYMGGKIDMFRANEARSMLTLLGTVAKNTNTAIVAVHHVRKSGEGALQHKVMGSADFINGVRSSLLVDISKGGQRYMAHVKSNWAKNGPTLAYAFGDKGFEWMGEYDGNTTTDVPEVSLNRRGTVEAWLRDHLKFGSRLAVDMLHLAAAEGFSERTLARAKKGIVKSDYKDGTWHWTLTDETIAQIQREELYAGGKPLASPGSEPTPEQLLQALGRGPGAIPQSSDPLAMAKAIMARKNGAAS